MHGRVPDLRRTAERISEQSFNIERIPVGRYVEPLCKPLVIYIAHNYVKISVICVVNVIYRTALYKLHIPLLVVGVFFAERLFLDFAVVVSEFRNQACLYVYNLRFGEIFFKQCCNRLGRLACFHKLAVYKAVFLIGSKGGRACKSLILFLIYKCMTF